MPNADVVLIHIKKKDVSDISASEWNTYTKFISDCMNGTGSVFTKRQWARALQMVGMKNDTLIRDIPYIKWVDLFRYKQTLKKVGKM